MMKTSFSITVTVLIMGILFIGCSKDISLLQPTDRVNQIRIEFNGDFLGAAYVDSTIAIWNCNGISKRLMFDKSDDTLYAGISALEKGKGVLTIKVFSSKKFGGQYASQWIFEKEYLLSEYSIIIQGPQAFEDINWKPRIELRDDVGHFALIALRPDDPYFLIKGVSQRVKKIALSREYWQQGGGLYRAGGGEWRCLTNCVNLDGNVENVDFFSFLPGQIGTSKWNHLEVTVLFIEDEWGGGYVLNATHSF